MKGSSKEKTIVPISHLRSIFNEMKKFNITRLTITRNGEKYEIQRDNNILKSSNNINSIHSDNDANINNFNQKNTKPAEKAEKSEELEFLKEPLTEIKTPIVGTFYRAPSPDSEPYVDIGSKVRKGDILCVVEAMKSMNEIESEYDGVIEDILVENGKPVEYEQSLFKIKLSS